MARHEHAYIIALSGGSGSGKSTLAEALGERLGAKRAALLSEDAYYRKMSDYGPSGTPGERASIIERINYDAPAAKEASLLLEHLEMLRARQPIKAPIYDYDRHDRSERTRTIAPADIIILEGIHALSLPEIQRLLDLKVYVDTPDDLRLARRIRRDVIERGRDVESVLAQYLGTVRAAHYLFTYPAKFSADLVIADEGLPAYGNVRPTSKAIQRMLAPVLERLARDEMIDAS